MSMIVMEGMMEKGVLEDITRRLLDGKDGKQVQLSESEIRKLCVNARQIFYLNLICFSFVLPSGFVRDSQVHVHWKGDAEIVLAACTTYMDNNEQLVPLDDEKVEYFKKAIEDMAAGSLRCVAIAYRPPKGETVPTDEEELSTWELPEGDLVLLAIVGLKDPCQPGVKDAVQLCVKAGVKVRMVTGDDVIPCIFGTKTYLIICDNCGIIYGLGS